MLKKTLKKQGGFTLLELLIVIVIIGILALLIIPNITSAPKKARDTTRKTDLRAIQKSLEEYYTENSAYPADAAAMKTALESGTPPLMKSVPQDPKTKAAYSYSLTSGSYTLKGCLENTSDSGQYVVADSSCGATNGKAFSLSSQN